MTFFREKSEIADMQMQNCTESWAFEWISECHANYYATRRKDWEMQLQEIQSRWKSLNKEMGQSNMGFRKPNSSDLRVRPEVPYTEKSGNCHPAHRKSDMQARSTGGGSRLCAKWLNRNSGAPGLQSRLGYLGQNKLSKLCSFQATPYVQVEHTYSKNPKSELFWHQTLFPTNQTPKVANCTYEFM